MSKRTKIIIISVIAVLLAVVLTLVVLEEVSKRTIKISNHTDKNITNLEVSFETEDSSEVIYMLYEGELKSGDSYKGSFDTMDFRTVNADIGVLVTFEGEEEIFLYDGFFYDRFDGTVDIDFHQADGKYWARMKAYTGLFKNSSKTGMKDDDFYFDFEENDFFLEGDEDVDELWYEGDDEIEFDDFDEYSDDEEEDEGDEYDDLFSDDEDF